MKKIFNIGKLAPFIQAKFIQVTGVFVLLAVNLFFETKASAWSSTCPPGWTTYPPPTCNGAGFGGGGGGSSSGSACSGGRCASAAFAAKRATLSEPGMPVCKIRKAEADFNLFDNPYNYQPATGPSMSLNLAYRTFVPTDFGYIPDNSVNPLFGPQWNCAWSSDVVIGRVQAGVAQSYWNYLGGRIIYTDFSGTPSVSLPATDDGSQMEILVDGSDNVIGGKIHQKDGTILTYQQASVNADQFLLSSITDPQGNSLVFTYDAYGRLNEIMDAASETTTFTYGDLDGDSDVSNDRLVTQISAPGGLSAHFDYLYSDDAAKWYLTNITDAVGLATKFAYAAPTTGTYGQKYVPLIKMTTPYGDTTFDRLTYNNWPTLLVTEPNGGQNLYVFAENYGSSTVPPVPETFDSAVIPT